MSAEIDYFRGLLKHGMNPTVPAPPPADPIDWKAFVHLLNVQAPLPLVTRPILEIHRTSASLRGMIIDFNKRSRRWSGLLTLELLRLIPALEESGCAPIVLKGPALAQTVYDSPRDRFFNDLDILIPADTWVTALRVLDKFGYHYSKTARHPSYYEQHHFHKAVQNNMGVRIELHWDLSKPADYYRFDLNDWRKSSRSIEVNGVRIAVPSDEKQLLHAAAQAVSEGFIDLRRVVDAAFLLRNGSLQLSSVAKSARNQGIQYGLWTLLDLLRTLGGLEVSTELMLKIQPPESRRNCIRSLSLAEKMLDRSTVHRSGLRTWIYWLCCPDPRLTRSKAYSYLFPDDVHLLEMGYSPDSMPSLLNRFRISAIMSWSLLKLTAYQAWCLTKSRLIGS